MNYPVGYEPSPSEVEEACREIRDGWDAREHERRAGVGARQPWTVPECHSHIAEPEEQP